MFIVLNILLYLHIFREHFNSQPFYYSGLSSIDGKLRYDDTAHVMLTRFTQGL